MPEPSPQLQNVWARSGLTNALGASGNWSMGTGTTGMANIARNLGLDQLAYYNNILNQFQLANNTFRPRTFGLSGGDAANIALSNIAGRNNSAQAKYAYDYQTNQYNAGIANQQAVAAANANNAQTSNIVGGVGSAVSLALVAFA